MTYLKMISMMAMAFVMLLSLPSDSKQLFTWIDKDGMIHITEQPPPDKAQLKDTVQYTPHTTEEIWLYHEQERKERARLRRERAFRREVNRIESGIREGAIERLQHQQRDMEEMNIDAQERIRDLNEAFREMKEREVQKQNH